MTAPESHEIVVVGGGLAGSAVALILARAGRAVTLIERAPAYRWHAGGVFTSPAAVVALRRLGLSEAVLGDAVRPTPAMRVETRAGVRFRLTYGDDGSLARSAVGLDRAVLDPALLAEGASAGVEVRRGISVTGIAPPTRASDPIRVETQAGSEVDGAERTSLDARVVVGADGIRSIVARSLGVTRSAPFGGRVGLTFHLPDVAGAGPRDARMVLVRDGYIGIAPVPRDRVNVGIVLGASWRRRLREDGAERTCAEVIGRVPAADDDPAAWRTAVRSDPIAGAAPIAHRVARRSGPGWFLVGDAAGFLDPFTGEGIHRALISAELAADSIQASLARGASGAAERYDRAMRQRFLGKDRVSGLVQAFLGRPALFEYAARRIASRDPVRETVGLVMGDLEPAERALDPRFLASLLAP